MKTLYGLILCLILITGADLVVGVLQYAGARKPKPETVWSYQTFEYPTTERRRDESTGQTYYLITCFVDYDSSSDATYSLTNNVFGPETILNAIGNDGWQFVAVDASNHYLVRRPKGIKFQHDAFAVKWDAYRSSQP